MLANTSGEQVEMQSDLCWAVLTVGLIWLTRVLRLKARAEQWKPVELGTSRRTASIGCRKLQLNWTVSSMLDLEKKQAIAGKSSILLYIGGKKGFKVFDFAFKLQFLGWDFEESADTLFNQMTTQKLFILKLSEAMYLQNKRILSDRESLMVWT